jgi:acetoacetate decarboxylase
MDEAILRKAAFAMPLSNRSYPPGPSRFIEQEYMIISYRTDFLIEPIAGNDLRETYNRRYHARA